MAKFVDAHSTQPGEYLLLLDDTELQILHEGMQRVRPYEEMEGIRETSAALRNLVSAQVQILVRREREQEARNAGCPACGAPQSSWHPDSFHAEAYRRSHSGPQGTAGE